MIKETTRRSLLKAFSWRILATLATMVLVYLFVGRIEIALVVGGADVIVKTVLYYGHERIWNRINLGRALVEREREGEKQKKKCKLKNP